MIAVGGDQRGAPALRGRRRPIAPAKEAQSCAVTSAS